MKLQILAKLKDSRTNWKYILIVVILVFIASGGILTFHWWIKKEELKMPEIKITKKRFIEISSDNRMLLDQEKWEKLGINTEEIGKEFNLDPPNTTVLYSNPAKGISLQIPYNPKWGSERYKIPAYYEYEEKVLFGPIFPFEAGSVARGCSISFLQVRSAEEAVASLKELAYGRGEFPSGVEKESIITETINNITVVKYIFVDSLIGSIPRIEVVGKKYNYLIECWYGWHGMHGAEKTIEVYEKIIGTIQFIE